MPAKKDEPDLFTRLLVPPTPPPTRHDLPDDYGTDLIPLGLDSVPGWLRFPGEEGYLEFDRWGRLKAACATRQKGAS